MGVQPQNLDVEAHPFLDNPLVVLAPTDHPLAREKHIAFSRLLSEPLVLRERGSGTRTVVERYFADRGHALHARMELGSNEAIKQAVASGLGITIMSLHALTLSRRTDGSPSSMSRASPSSVRGSWSFRAGSSCPWSRAPSSTTCARKAPCLRPVRTQTPLAQTCRGRHRSLVRRASHTRLRHRAADGPSRHVARAARRSGIFCRGGCPSRS